MKIFFKTRQAARNLKSGKLVDNGTYAPKGKRWCREVKRDQLS